MDSKIVVTLNEPRHGISNHVVCATSKASDQPAHTRSLIRDFASRLNVLSVKLLTEHILEVQSLKGGCTGSSESTLNKMPHCWKSHVTAQMLRTLNSKSPGLRKEKNEGYFHRGLLIVWCCPAMSVTKT